MPSKTALSLLFAVIAALTASAHATLYDRGNGMVYDSNTNLTWLQDMNYAKTSGYSATGLMTWARAAVWTMNLNVGGFHDWYLPYDMERVFLVELGNTGPLTNTGPFLNLQSNSTYWMLGPLTLAPYTVAYSSADGAQLVVDPETHYYATAVRVGDIPVPAAMWLLGSGLIGLAGLARRQ